ncbi:MAG: hypothetical protein ACREGC_01880 [Minisyncoccia bacterium]
MLYYFRNGQLSHLASTLKKSASAQGGFMSLTSKHRIGMVVSLVTIFYLVIGKPPDTSAEVIARFIALIFLIFGICLLYAVYSKVVKKVDKNL